MNKPTTLENRYLIGALLCSMISVSVLFFSMQPIGLYLSGIKTVGVVEKIEPYNNRCKSWSIKKDASGNNWHDCTMYAVSIILPNLQSNLTKNLQSYRKELSTHPTYFIYDSSSSVGHNQSVSGSNYQEGQEVELIVDPSVIDNFFITENIAIKKNLIQTIQISSGISGIAMFFFIFFLMKYFKLRKNQSSNIAG